ncbi:MAG: hypothetical protein ABIX37_03835 [Gammaproteobacteria bacterium]
MPLVKASVTLFAAIAMCLGLAGCGNPSGLSGTYEADMGDGGAVRIVFEGGDKAKVSLVGPGGQGAISHNTVYTAAGKKLHFTTDEPFGAPMDLIYDNGELTDGSGTVFKKK